MVNVHALLQEVRTNSKREPFFKDQSVLEPFSTRLQAARPSRTLAVIALPWRRLYRPERQYFVAIARYRTPFSIIKELAQAIAPVVLEVGFVPVIQPITSGAFSGMTWDTPLVQRLVKDGLIVHERKGTQ